MRTTKRVLVAFAVEDKYYRDLLKGQSLYTKSPFEYTDMSVQGTLGQRLEGEMSHSY